MTPLILAACLLMGLPAGTCRAEAQAQDLTAWAQTVHTEQAALEPEWATLDWRDYAASIVAGESPPACAICDLWIACTLRRDVERGLSPWELYGKDRRWHGWRDHFTPANREAVDTALRADGCDDVPRCRYLGNTRDFQYNWTGAGVEARITGNAQGLVVCVVENKEGVND